MAESLEKIHKIERLGWKKKKEGKKAVPIMAQTDTVKNLYKIGIKIYHNTEVHQFMGHACKIFRRWTTFLSIATGLALYLVVLLWGGENGYFSDNKYGNMHGTGIALIVVGIFVSVAWIAISFTFSDMKLVKVKPQDFGHIPDEAITIASSYQEINPHFYSRIWYIKSEYRIFRLIPMIFSPVVLYIGESENTARPVYKWT